MMSERQQKLQKKNMYNDSGLIPAQAPSSATAATATAVVAVAGCCLLPMLPNMRCTSFTETLYAFGSFMLRMTADIPQSIAKIASTVGSNLADLFKITLAGICGDQATPFAVMMALYLALNLSSPDTGPTVDAKQDCGANNFFPWLLPCHSPESDAVRYDS